MDVSICIVSWNTRELLARCLRSIRTKTDGLAYEIIVVDNGSADGSAAMVRHEFPECRLIASTVNLGFVRGNNRAVAEATGSYVLYLNPDTELVTNAVSGMFQFLEHHSAYDAAGCRLINPDGSIQFTCASTYPTPFRELCQALFLNRIFKGMRLFSARELDYWDHRDSRSVDCLSGACMMVRRSVLEPLGGFDSNIFMYSEDLDLCYRIRQRGGQIYYLASEVIIHREGSSSSRRSNRNFALIQQKESNYYFLNKHYGPSRAERYRLVTGFGAVARIVGTLLFAPLVVLLANRGGKGLAVLLQRQLSLFCWAIGLLDATKQLSKEGC